MSKQTPETFWNGEPCAARVVTVVVGESPRPSWWCADLVGTKREAVEVSYHDARFYIDNKNGSGWHKVTAGRGLPNCYHASLPVREVVEP